MAIQKSVSIIIIIGPACCPMHHPSSGFPAPQTTRAHGPVLPLAALSNVLALAMLISKTYFITAKKKKKVNHYVPTSGTEIYLINTATGQTFLSQQNGPD